MFDFSKKREVNGMEIMIKLIPYTLVVSGDYAIEIITKEYGINQKAIPEIRGMLMEYFEQMTTDSMRRANSLSGAVGGPSMHDEILQATYHRYKRVLEEMKEANH